MLILSIFSKHLAMFRASMLLLLFVSLENVQENYRVFSKLLFLDIFSSSNTNNQTPISLYHFTRKPLRVEIRIAEKCNLCVINA